MPRYIAFLRAINVGGHTVTMVALREHFEALGFDEVETFIASGNVIFSSESRSAAALQKRIETRLLKSLGYEVRTFLRTDAELAKIACYKPFKVGALKTARALNVAFAEKPFTAQAAKALTAARNDVDDFHVQGREAYWLCTVRGSESPFFKVGFEKVLKVPVTVRNFNTVTKLATKYGGRAR